MKTMCAAELKRRLDKNEVLLIDVREPAEHRSECIEGAYLMPLSELSFDKLPSTSRPIVMHCRSGKRSQEACQKLMQQNPQLEVYSLEGGLSAWQQAGFQVKRSGSPVLPLDRQTQCAAGFLAFAGVLLGVSVHPIFYAVSGFVGLGLMFAGITGWCGMAKLLAKMPWNR
jgi:rhodanese-related sulfurtransferase